jgi:hypothetical protein
VPFHRTGQVEKFPRDENVDIHVREVTLNASAPESAQVEAVDIREFIKNGEVYGHGLAIPRREVRDLIVALEKVLAE